MKIIIKILYKIKRFVINAITKKIVIEPYVLTVYEGNTQTDLDGLEVKCYIVNDMGDVVLDKEYFLKTMRIK